MTDTKKLLALTSLLMALAIAFGAFGAHALEGILNTGRLDTWETAVRYHVWNTLGVMILLMVSKVFSYELKTPVYLILAGTFIFSGSLYILCLTDISWFGAITPVGGVSLIAGWSLAGLRILKSNL